MNEAWGGTSSSSSTSTTAATVATTSTSTAVAEHGGGGASGALVTSVTEMVNHRQVHHLLDIQSQVYKSLKASQESLTAFNDFSATLYRNTHRDFERRTKMIKDMQKDLEYIYKKLRTLKGKVEEVTGVPPEVVQATLQEMDRAKAAFLGELDERQPEEEEKDSLNKTEEQDTESEKGTAPEQESERQASGTAGERPDGVGEQHDEGEGPV